MPKNTEDLPTLELRPTLGEEPRWVVVAALFVGLVLGTLAIYAIFELIPELSRLFYPMSFPLMAGVFVPVVAILVAFYLFHRVVLSPQGVEVRWGLYRKLLMADAIEAAFYLEERAYRTLGATGRRNTIMFGRSFSGQDFERARNWLKAFAETRAVEFRALQNRKQLVGLIAEHM
jgi:hypothetical protein